MLKRSMFYLVLVFFLLSTAVLAETQIPSDFPDIPWEYTDGENRLGEIIFAQDQYITVGYDGIKVSSDLQTWESVADLGNEEQYIYGGWPAIAFNGSVYVVTGLSGGIFTSETGRKWHFYERPFDFDISEIIWDGQNFVAVGRYGREEFQEDSRPAGIIVSPDGMNWEKLDVTFDMPWGLRHIAYNGEVYVADGISEMFYSYDLLNWNPCDSFHAYNEGIEWVADRFIATRGEKNILYSFDGITWQTIDQSWDNTMWACVWNGNIFVAVGSDATIYVSYDGLHWICKTEWHRIDNTLYDVIWTGDSFVVLGSKNNLIWTPEDAVRLKVNGKPIVMDTAPVIENGRALVPVRAAAEALGADVYWDEKTEIVGIIKNDTKVLLKVNEPEIVKFTGGDMDEYIHLHDDRVSNINAGDAPPRLVGSRVLVPIRAVSEGLGIAVSWDEENNSVLLTCDESFIAQKNTDQTFFDKFIQRFVGQ